MQLPDAPGLGVTLNETVLEAAKNKAKGALQ
jgi:L-alanine-DL-glutamate epimerase-like enolase superfamily enzyme